MAVDAAVVAQGGLAPTHGPAVDSVDQLGPYADVQDANCVGDALVQLEKEDAQSRFPLTHGPYIDPIDAVLP